MRRTLLILLGCAVLGAALGWVLTRPDPLEPNYAQGLTPDPQAGALIFAAGGCVSCHAVPKSEDEAQLVLAGGLAFPSKFGTFYAPNISPDPEQGIGTWTLPQFARAVTRGVSPEGQHYYPAFPYTAYGHLAPQDVANLFAYMQSLPASDTPSQAHEVGFPFNIRRSLGMWKLLFADDDYVLSGDHDAEVLRGRYLAEGLAHCGECHTPRNALGALDRSAWLTGAPNPSGKGKIPGITPAQLEWSKVDLVEYFTSGFTPEYDSAGGEMAEVVRNLSQLPESDRAAIAAYLKALPGD
ncbi:cytochrome c [Sulfitobacter delicatus]|uniref:Cytochrome c, mono-and diheme variants n=1 Tax=Sulfitobacter delicatus TaxID=218672 RepID=A0A1G7SCD0_9RHOB|nr:cytochrome c [Sulfitobacter delicatus]SDG19840.1 Cytochrome c, mono-and diheme variants [Sulfitobacter delicatus]